MLVVNSLYVKAHRGPTLHGTKTDSVDAQFIATLSAKRTCLVRLFQKRWCKQGLRGLTRLRADLVAQISDVKHRAIAVLDRTFPKFSICFRDVFGLTARTVLEE